MSRFEKNNQPVKLDANGNLDTSVLERELTAALEFDVRYKQQDNMKNIRTTGLLTHNERNASGVQSNYNGSVYGDGVYTGNNPFAFSSYGNVGLLLARLKGKVGKEEIDWRQITSSACGQDKDNPVDIDEDEPAPSVDPDTVVGNKQLPCGADKASASTGSGGQSASPYFDEVVLKQSSQCVALVSRFRVSRDESRVSKQGIISSRKVFDLYLLFCPLF